jgi:transposase
MSYGRLEKEEQRLAAVIAEDLKAAVAEDEAEAKERRKGPKGPGGEPEDRKLAEQRLENVRKAKAELEQRAQEREENRQAAVRAKGKKPRPSKQGGKPKAGDQYNFTDPESRVMKDGQGTIIQGFNAQAAVDCQSQIIVAATLTNVAPDVGHLQEIVDQAERNTGRRAKHILADAGYFSEKNVQWIEGRGQEALIPPVRISHMQWRTAKAPRGRPPKNLTTKERMLRKLHTKRGKELYKRRETSVEPVFGQIKWARNLRQLSFRGLAKAKASWLFECAVHNLSKMYRAGIAWA